MAPDGHWNSLAVSSHGMTAGWLAAATQMKLREPNVTPRYFMPDAVPAATFQFTRAMGQPIVCWIVHSGLVYYTNYFGSNQLEFKKVGEIIYSIQFL